MKSLITLSLLAAGLLAAAGCQDRTMVRGPNDERIIATTPSSLTVHRGETVPFRVAVDRENFRGPVSVKLEQLSRGINVDDRTQKVETDAATFILRVARDADLVRNQAVKVTIEGKDGRAASQYFDLTVLD